MLLYIQRPHKIVYVISCHIAKQDTICNTVKHNCNIPKWTQMATTTLTPARRNYFFNRVIKVINKVVSCNIIRWFSPHPLKSCWLLNHSIREGT